MLNLEDLWPGYSCVSCPIKGNSDYEKTIQDAVEKVTLYDGAVYGTKPPATIAPMFISKVDAQRSAVSYRNLFNEMLKTSVRFLVDDNVQYVEFR